MLQKFNLELNHERKPNMEFTTLPSFSQNKIKNIWKFSHIILWFWFKVKNNDMKLILFPDDGRLAKFSKDDETHSDSWFSELRTFAALLCILVHTCRWFSHLLLRKTKNSKLDWIKPWKD